MMEPEENVLQEVLQRLTCYFVESRIQQSIVETQIAERDPVEEEEQEIQNEAALVE